MKEKLKKYRLIIITIILYGLFFLFKPEAFHKAIELTGSFLVEMLQVLPPVLVISALITVWVPSEIIKKGLGEKSGIRGKLLSILIGSISAGPIYAAFPAALVLYKKGMRISNLVIILSSWAVIKIPMVLVETGFLGIKFALTRVAMTIPAILIMSSLIEKFINKKDIVDNLDEEQDSPKKILSLLPNLDCGGCGYKSCGMFAEAVFKREKKMDGCIVLEKKRGREAQTVTG